MSMHLTLNLQEKAVREQFKVVMNYPQLFEATRTLGYSIIDYRLTAPTAKADGIPNSQRAALHRIFDAESSSISKG